MSEQSSTPDEENPESFVSHLIELRDRLLRSVIVVLIVFIPAAVFSGKLFTVLAAPMLSALSTDGTMISTEVAGPFLVPLKFAFALSIAIAIPYLLYQIWSFIAPGLYDNEKRLAFPLLLSSTLLFYCGIAFAYFVVFPIMFSFFPSVAPMGIEVTPDINHYLGFVLKLFFAFGIAFEVPIATILLIKAGITTREKLASKRQYVVLGAFVVGMLLTPPDIFSQTMLAVPIWLLFELGLVMSKLIGGPLKEDQDVDEAEETESEESAAGASDEETTMAKDADDTDAANEAVSGVDNEAEEKDITVPGVMPQQERAATDEEDEAADDDGEDDEEEEDIDELAQQLDELEDITSWVTEEKEEEEKEEEEKPEDDVGETDKKEK